MKEENDTGDNIPPCCMPIRRSQITTMVYIMVEESDDYKILNFKFVINISNFVNHRSNVKLFNRIN